MSVKHKKCDIFSEQRGHSLPWSKCLLLNCHSILLLAWLDLHQHRLPGPKCLWILVSQSQSQIRTARLLAHPLTLLAWLRNLTSPFLKRKWSLVRQLYTLTFILGSGIAFHRQLWDPILLPPRVLFLDQHPSFALKLLWILLPSRHSIATCQSLSQSL